MRYVAGVDVGSAYVKALLLREDRTVVAKVMRPTGFQFEKAACDAYEDMCRRAGVSSNGVAYVVSTGFGRAWVPFRDAQATDLTAHARGALALFPRTRTVLDIGAQTMKASRLDGAGKVAVFRLNDKCAAGTGAFLEKTARYLGFSTEEIGPLAATSKTPVSISGVCAVFAESEVINHVSSGAAPSDIIQGAIVSLVERAVQLMRRVRMEPEYTLAGGILRFPSLAAAVGRALVASPNVPEGDLAQFNGALGAAYLALKRLAAAGRAGDGRAARRFP